MSHGAGITVLCKPSFLLSQFYLCKAVFIYIARSPRFIPSPCFNPLNLAKIAYFAKWVKGAKCVSSDFLNEKVSMILTCIILKIKAQLK